MSKFARLIARLERRAVPGIILVIITIVIFPGLPVFPPEAHAAQLSSQLPPFVGRVCLTPGESTSCPLTLPAMTGSSSGHLNVSINILGSTIFNFFDISVRWDPTIMNSTSVDLSGTILPSFIVIALCINGAGSGCGSLDGPGVAHVSARGTNTTAPASGRLFKIPFFINFGVSASVGFQTGCFLPSVGGPPIPSGSVPNTSVCVQVAILNTIGTPSVTPVPESIQSQLLGVPLPTPIGSLGGNIAGLDSGGGAPNFADTWILPLTINLPGNITTWKVQFRPVLLSNGNLTDPIGVQIKVLRKTSATTLMVVGAGLVHSPIPILQSRQLGYPFVLTESTVIEFFSDPGIAVLPGDLIGLTIMSNPLAGFYIYPFVNATGTRSVASDVTIGGTIDLSSPFTGTLSQGPALQVFIQVPPPSTDTAGDGVPDFVKLSPEMHALGADPCRKTVAAQLDYMIRPRQEAVDTVVASFDAAPVPAVLPCPYLGFPLKSTGVKLILDVKNAIPFQESLNFTHTDPLTFDSVKAAFFDPNRARYFHYGIFANTLDGSTVSGAAEIFGQDFMVTLGRWPNGGSVSEQAGTIMHELGHNLGLDHGGNSAVNFKANYLSVMNYVFQVVGITTQIPGGGNVTRFDFSSQTLPSLNESALDESVGLASLNDITRWACPDGRHVNFGVVSGPLDWNCSGVIDSQKVRVDVNNDTTLETLTGFNDWASLRYNFPESEAFGVGCHIGCNIGCHIGCNIGEELTFPQALVIEAQWRAFFATPHHSTSTNVNCSPVSVPVNSPTTCAATVTDNSVGGALTPTGTVTFGSSLAGSFTPTAMCSLSGTGASAGCSVTYTPNPSPNSIGSQTISAAYPGDGNHFSSSGSAIITGFLQTMTITTSTTLTADITGAIVIGANQVSLNCNGHAISGVSTSPTSSPSSGILLDGKSGVTIQNCRVSNFFIGFLLVNSTRNTLTGDSATGNGFGFLLSSSTNNLLSGDTANANGRDGFLMQSSSNNDLLGDTANNNMGSGFRLVSSLNNNLEKSTANSNTVYGFALVLASNNNLVAGNSACGNGVFDAFQTGSTNNRFSKNLFCATSGL